MTYTDFTALPLEVKRAMNDIKVWDIVEIKNTSCLDFLSYNIIQVNGNLVFLLTALKSDNEWFFINKTYSLAYFEDLKKAKDFIKRRNN